MSSDLQHVCDSLSRSTGAIERVAAELAGRARALKSAAARVQAASPTGSGRMVAGSMAQSLFEAAHACERASALLRLAAREGADFVARTVASGAGSGTTAAFGTTSRPALPELTAGQAAFLADTRRTAAGIAIFDRGDTELLDTVDAMPVFPGEFVVDVHGSSDRVGINREPPVDLDAKAFASVLRASGWPGEPVRLVSCSTGRDPEGFAQQLAEELGVPVTAPTTEVWVGDGDVRVVQAELAWNPVLQMSVPAPIGPPGRWVRYEPRGHR